ncbi:DUF3795 domain-containing protein [bacterium]|nr:DUF3795 domain-containing protein [bacterium]
MIENGGYCGIDCAKCPAFIATKADDTEAYKKIAADWSEMYGAEIPPENIPCAGCFASSPEPTGCHAGECEIRACAIEKKVLTCAECPEFACDRLTEFFTYAPEAKANLEARRGG